MNQYTLANLSGRSIPPDAKLAITGVPTPGGYLVIETYSGTTGVATWRTEEEFNKLRSDSTAPARPAWAPPLKPKAPYS